MDNIGEIIKEYFNLKELHEYKVVVNKGSIGNKLANNTNSNIRGFFLKSNKKVVANVRSSMIINNVKKLTNIHDNEKFKKLYDESYKVFGLEQIHLRESSIYKNIDKSLKNNMPNFIENILFEDKNIVITECFNKSESLPTLKQIIEFLVKLHVRYLNKEEESKKIVINSYSEEDFFKSRDLLLMMFENFRELYKEKIDINILDDIKEFINNIDCNLNICRTYHKTLNHGDYSYKNMCKLEDGNLCVYDWEFCAFLNLQYDIINFMEYDTVNYINKEYINNFINLYIQAFEKQSKIQLDIEEFYIVFKRNLYISFINRIIPRLIMHKIVPLELSDEILKNWITIYKILK